MPTTRTLQTSQEQEQQRNRSASFDSSAPSDTSDTSKSDSGTASPTKNKRSGDTKRAAVGSTRERLVTCHACRERKDKSQYPRTPNGKIRRGPQTCLKCSEPAETYWIEGLAHRKCRVCHEVKMESEFNHYPGGQSEILPGL